MWPSLCRKLLLQLSHLEIYKGCLSCLYDSICRFVVVYFYTEKAVVVYHSKGRPQLQLSKVSVSKLKNPSEWWSDVPSRQSTVSALARTPEPPSLWPEARTARRKPELQTLQHWLIICCHHHPDLWLVRLTSLFRILGFKCWDGNSECENSNNIFSVKKPLCPCRSQWCLGWSWMWTEF